MECPKDDGQGQNWKHRHVQLKGCPCQEKHETGMAMRGGGEQAEAFPSLGMGGSAGDGEDLTLYPGVGEGDGDGRPGWVPGRRGGCADGRQSISSGFGPLREISHIIS